jgi:hypothetical protein
MMFRHLKLSKNDFLEIKYHTSIIWCIDLIHAWLDENTCSPFLYAIWTKDMRLLLSPLICLKISRPSIFLGQMDYIPKLFTSLQNWSWVHTINLLARKIPNPINVLGAGFFYRPLSQFIPRLPLLPLRSGIKKRGKKYYTEPIKPLSTVYRSVCAVYRSVFILLTNRSYHGKKNRGVVWWWGEIIDQEIDKVLHDCASCT